MAFSIMVSEPFYTICEMQTRDNPVQLYDLSTVGMPQPKFFFHLDLVLRTLVCLKIFLIPFFRIFPSIPNLFTFIQTDQRQIPEWEQRYFLTNLQYLSHCLIRPRFLPLNCMLFYLR